MHKVTDDPLKTYVQPSQMYAPHRPRVYDSWDADGTAVSGPHPCGMAALMAPHSSHALEMT